MISYLVRSLMNELLDDHQLNGLLAHICTQNDD
jgi:hypothetical protein